MCFRFRTKCELLVTQRGGARILGGDLSLKCVDLTKSLTELDGTVLALVICFSSSQRLHVTCNHIPSSRNIL